MPLAKAVVNSLEVLVVDDSREVLEMTQSGIQTSLQCPVLVAGDPYQAIDMLQQHPHIVAVVIDLVMSEEISGIELLQELRRQGFAGYAIAMTAYGDSQSRVECLSEGLFNSYYEKPFSQHTWNNFLQELQGVLE